MVLQFSYFTVYFSAQQSAQVEPVSGTSRVVSTTFQQNKSAKKNLKKSNNENVSTILQESDESGTIKILNISMMYLYTEFPDIGINRIL
jgi:hypothetical protein